MALVFGSFVAYAYYKDFLAAFLFICAIIPSSLFEEGRKEYKASKENSNA